MDTPVDSREQILVYKSVQEREIALSFLPPLKDRYEYAPLYLIIPGGGWYSENRYDMLDFSKISVRALREEGFAAACIDYRTAREEGIGIGESILDCFDAARYLSHFSGTLKIDPNRFVISGHSAGGHLSLMLAYAPHDMFRTDSVLEDDFRAAAAVPISAPTILYREGVEQTLNFDYSHAVKKDASPVSLKKVSPISYVSSKCPPTILCQGTSDRVVFPNSAELLYKKLQENGVRSKLVLSLGGGHCFEQMHDGVLPSPSREEIQQIITKFILNTVGSVCGGAI